jgi:hypothetical protein
MPTVVKGNFQASDFPHYKKQFHLGMGREVKDRKELYFDITSSNRESETYFEVGDFGSVPEFDAELQYEGVQQGYTNTITNKVYGKGIRIEYKFTRTDQQRVAKMLPKFLGLAFRRRIAGDSASWFNEATSTYLTRDGLSLVNAAHTSNVGGSNQANRITSAFSAVALAAARITHRKILSNTDQVLDVMPTVLYGSIDLQDPFEEVIKSKGQVNTANNTINVMQGAFTAVTDRRFEDTDNWAIADKQLQKEFNIWQTVDNVSFEQAKDFDGRTAKYAGWSFHGAGSTGWEWILYSEVS